MPGRAVRREQDRILAEALARARAAAPYGVAVFDLDSTLLDNRPRQARIAQDYGRSAGLPVLLGARPEHWRGWDLEAGLAAAGLPPALARPHRSPFRRFWAERFFTSAYCAHDVALPGAAAFVASVAESGARVAYVTGRPARMEDGTLEVLRRHGFPLPDGIRARLLMKASDALGDDEWKALACAELDAWGPVVLAFDNEPAHVNAYARAWPGALAVHLDTDHSGRPVEVDASIPSVADLRLAAELAVRVVSAGAAGARAGVR